MLILIFCCKLYNMLVALICILTEAFHTKYQANNRQIKKNSYSGLRDLFSRFYEYAGSALYVIATVIAIIIIIITTIYILVCLNEFFCYKSWISEHM